MAEHLGVSAAMVSQILSGEKTLHADLGIRVSEFVGLNDKETDYFLQLIEYERAGYHRLKSRLLKKIEQAQAEAKNLSQRVQVDREMDEKDRAIYYSSWLYTAIRNLSALGDGITPDEISVSLQIPRPVVVRVLQFLTEKGLCTEDKGRYSYQQKWTHIPAGSPFVARHHQNWRLQGFHRMESFHDEDFFLTAPMSMSAEVANRIRARILELVTEVQKEVGPSKSEVVRCLNIDWFRW
ncbi:MAG: TIGR02147 family protein [Calothrix sp. SM1_5_4]|nr:TIGR02147 family protein [Calothrix sp. SM1_5_4]